MRLSRELTAAKIQVLTQQRGLVLASDEIEKMRKHHTKEVMKLEMDLRRKEREARKVVEDLRICKGDLDSEREQVAMLKGCVAQRANLTAVSNELNKVWWELGAEPPARVDVVGLMLFFRGQTLSLHLAIF